MTHYRFLGDLSVLIGDPVVPLCSLISWSEMCFKNLGSVHFFDCLLNFHLFFFTEDLVENLPLKILMMSHYQYLNPLMSLRH